MLHEQTCMQLSMGRLANLRFDITCQGLVSDAFAAIHIVVYWSGHSAYNGRQNLSFIVTRSQSGNQLRCVRVL
jgi:hypothetical protein